MPQDSTHSVILETQLTSRRFLETLTLLHHTTIHNPQIYTHARTHARARTRARTHQGPLAPPPGYMLNHNYCRHRENSSTARPDRQSYNSMNLPPPMRFLKTCFFTRCNGLLKVECGAVLSSPGCVFSRCCTFRSGDSGSNEIVCTTPLSLLSCHRRHTQRSLSCHCHLINQYVSPAVLQWGL